jgi:hypothetical protein
VEWAIEWVKTEGTKLIDTAKNTLINDDTKWAIDGLKKDATGLFDDLKKAAAQ